MKKLVLLLLMLPVGVYAGDVSITWLQPQNNEDCTIGAPLTDLAGYRVYREILDIPDPAILSFTDSGLLPGDYSYAVTAYNTAGAESRPVRYTETVSTFAVSETTAYIVVKIANSFLLLVAGTVPLGTTCDETQSINGHYAVPVSAVTITGTVEPLVVVAKCGA